MSRTKILFKLICLVKEATIKPQYNKSLFFCDDHEVKTINSSEKTNREGSGCNMTILLLNVSSMTVTDLMFHEQVSSERHFSKQEKFTGFVNNKI